MYAQQFGTKPQQYGYTTYQPAQTGIDMNSIMQLMMMMMVMGMMMGMMKPLMGGMGS